MNQRATAGVLSLLLAQPALASDHIDGVPSLERHEQVDLTDLYLFDAPDDPSRLALVLNMYPGVDESGHFSSKVSYRLEMRTLTHQGGRLIPEAVNEIEVLCRFTDPDHHHGGDGDGTVACDLSRGGAPLAVFSGPVGEVLTTDVGAAFFGPRADPFILNAAVFQEVSERRGFTRQEPGSGHNMLSATNVLTITMALDRAALFGGASPTIGVVAESFTTERGREEVLDRLGRGEVTNLSLHAHGDAAPLKMRYNTIGAFEAPSAEHRAILAERLRENVRAYDGYDSRRDWSDSDLDALITLLLDDFLVMDLSADCAAGSAQYFSIERALLVTGQPAGCGGRRFTDDMFAFVYALYIGGLQAPIADFETGVSSPYQDSPRSLSEAFPYQDEPYATGFPWINVSRFLLNTVLKKNQD